MLSKLFSHNMNPIPKIVLAILIAIILFLIQDYVINVNERYMSIPLQLSISNDLVVVSDLPEQVRIRLHGASRDILRMVEEDLNAVLDLANITEEGVFDVKININVLGESSKIKLLEISTEPDSMEVTIEEKVNRVLAISPSITGVLPAGYELNNLSLFPSAIEVSGPRSRIDELTSINTEAIDISGRRRDFSERIRLSKGDLLINFIGGATVEVMGQVSRRIVRRSYEKMAVKLSNLVGYLELVNDSFTVDIELEGWELDIRAIDTQGFDIIADLGEFKQSGTYNIPVQLIFPRGEITVLDLVPQQIQIGLRRRE